MRSIVIVLALCGAAHAQAPTYLAGPMTLYIHTNGTDVGNSCLVEVSPCQTLQHAYNTLVESYDSNLKPIKIKMTGDGSARVFTSGLVASQPLRGGGILTIEGDCGNPALARVEPNNGGSGFWFTAGTQFTARVEIDCVKIRAPGAYGIRNGACLEVWFGNVIFDTAGGHFGTENHCSYIRVKSNSQYRVVGGATNAHADADAGFIAFYGVAVLENTPSFGQCFLTARYGGRMLVGNAPNMWTGNVQGTGNPAAPVRPYCVEQNGLITNKGGPTIPSFGGLPGLEQTGGVYAPF